MRFKTPVVTALDMQRARAADVARELVARSPAGTVACVFAGGSLSRGEVWAATFDGGLEIYSDVDLYVVVTRSSAREAVRRAAAQTLQSLRDPNGVRFMRAPDVGVYDTRELAALPVRPGTVDLAGRHVLLHGGEDTLRPLRAWQPHDIPADEALYLIENRLFELRASVTKGNRAHARLQLIAALKATLDIHAAHLVVERAFLPSLDERRRRFVQSPPAGLGEQVGAYIALAYTRTLSVEKWLKSADASEETRASRRALAAAWLALAPTVLACPPSTSAVELLARRCGDGQHLANARAVIRLRRHAGMSLWSSLAAAMALSRCSPRAALRVDALARQLAEDGAHEARRHDHYVDALTRRFGKTSGSLEARARDMHALIS